MKVEIILLIRYVTYLLRTCGLKVTMTDAGLFGQNIFAPKGKYITITEGEVDAMSAFELLGSKWACVSS